jgi:hypothetical protein
MRLSYRSIETIDHSDRSQVFGIAWIPTYFGKARAVFVCSSCRGGANRLFDRYGSYACRYCHRALNASQRNTIRSAANASPHANCAYNSAACQNLNESRAQVQMDAPQDISTHPQRNPKPRSQNQRTTVQEAP